MIRSTNFPLAALAATSLAACASGPGATQTSGASGGSSGSTSGTTGRLPDSSVGMLEAVTGVTWVAMSSAVKPGILFPTQPPPASFTPTGNPDQDQTAAVAAAQAFFAQYGAIWEMTNPASELTLDRYDFAPDAFVVELDQQAQGLPVFDRSFTLAFDLNGRLQSVSSNYVPGLQSLSIAPSVAPQDALNAAVAAYAAKFGASDVPITGTPQLGIEPAPDTDVPALAYRINLLGASDSVEYMVDANQGTVLEAGSMNHALNGTGNGQRGASEQFPVLPQNTAAPAPPALALLNDLHNLTPHLPKGPNIPDPSYFMGLPLGVAANNQGGVLPPLQFFDIKVDPPQPIFSSNLGSWDTTGATPGSAVDVGNHMAVTTKFFLNAHGWNSYNDKGSVVYSFARVPSDVGDCNAFWHTQCKAGRNCPQPDQNYMCFLDSDANCPSWYNVGTALDVVGHEFGHGITSGTSKFKNCPLTTPTCSTSTLNEAMSDVLGSMVEHSVTPNLTKNYEMGETIYRMLPAGKTSLRDMSKPSQSDEVSTAHMSVYCNAKCDANGKNCNPNCDEHTNATIPGNAYYLMGNGGMNEISTMVVDAGIGWVNAEKIWWQSEAQCLHSTATFWDVAKCNLDWANADALGQNVNPYTLVQPIACAWWAVGLNVTDGGVVDPKGKNLPIYVGGDWNVCCGDQSDGGCDGGCVANQKTCDAATSMCCNTTDFCSPSTVDGGDGGNVCCVPDGNPDPSDGGTGKECCSEQSNGMGLCGAPCVKNQQSCSGASLCCNSTDSCTAEDGGTMTVCCVADGNADPDGTGKQCCAGKNDGTGLCGLPCVQNQSACGGSGMGTCCNSTDSCTTVDGGKQLCCVPDGYSDPDSSGAQCCSGQDNGQGICGPSMNCTPTGTSCTGGQACCSMAASCQSDGISNVCCFPAGTKPDNGDQTGCCNQNGLNTQGQCF